MTRDLRNRIWWLIFFSIAMGFLEAAIVVYLRWYYYPDGFAFPMVLLDEKIAVVELFREAATIIMLAGVGILGGRTAKERFAFFLASFAIWDIFYYVFLKIILDWPESLLTWDILFLIPVPWVGPVITPCIISLTMIALGTVLVVRDVQGTDKKLSAVEWILLIAGSIVVIASWTWEYLNFSRGMDPLEAFAAYVPESYPWVVFFIGEALLLVPIYLFWKRSK